MINRAVQYIDIIEAIERLIERLREYEVKYEEQIRAVHPRYLKSAINLVHYWALRQEDISDLQNNLKKLGLSRLARAEAHILASLHTTLAIVKSLSSQKPLVIHRALVSISKSEKYLKRNTKALLGAKTKGRSVRIMVTQPVISANDQQLVENMLLAGMNTARINCAHDNAKVWGKIIANVKASSRENGLDTRICMDLGGPKVRTGNILSGPGIKKLRPSKDEYGKIVSPFEFYFVEEGVYQGGELNVVPVNADFFKRLEAGGKIKLIDARGKKRKIDIVSKVDQEKVLAKVKSATYLSYQTELTLIAGKQVFGGKVGKLTQSEGTILLNKNDEFLVHKTSLIGSDAVYDENGELIERARISFTLPEIFEDVRVGERILFDDGKIEGIIQEKKDDHFIVKITNAGIRGSKLRADKGINFPESSLNIRGLTEKDKGDLPFVAQHADVVNFSFVNHQDDVKDLHEELKKIDAPESLGVILKIETQKGFNNLFHILLEAMKTYPIGVMIARGDLAIECGWQNIARIQEEIISLCNAAHVPAIWATQVLENMAKKGLPSRAEITDAASAQKAECVMLNKGPNIVDAIRLLDVILRNMKGFKNKKASMLPAIK